jgi:hypothetical protein
VGARTAVEREIEELEEEDKEVEAILSLLPFLTKTPDPYCRHCQAGVPRPHVHEAFDE